MSKRAYLFDMDGVLVDNCRYHVIAWLEFAKRHGGRLTEEQIIAWMGATGRDYLERMFNEPLTDARVAELMAEKEAIYRELYLPHLEPRQGLIELLEDARRQNISCAVVTGGSMDNVNFILDGLKIREYFTCIVDASQYQRGKPAPDCYLQAAAKVGAAPRDCVVFEDAINGIESGRAAGMCVVALVGTNPREVLEKAAPDMIIDHSQDIWYNTH